MVLVSQTHQKLTEEKKFLREREAGSFGEMDLIKDKELQLYC